MQLKIKHNSLWHKSHGPIYIEHKTTINYLGPNKWEIGYSGDIFCNLRKLHDLFLNFGWLKNICILISTFNK